ncbi:MAG: NADH-quinone oxidoreductase subunit NuoG [Anaerolineae bacterium]|nr:NADH-quinone oxidoreductase subunit NuoG [Anaerolineae bacterium]
MSDLVSINVDGVDIEVPAGTTVVDAAMRADIQIPVFCHHPKLEPVGMCRMCLVRIGMPVRDRATGELLKEPDGSVQYNWGRTLQTGCTVRVAPGMHVVTNSAEAKDARDDIIEFLLTSHPLDCPICDKGGECPLQNLTMAHGGGTSRFNFNDKLTNDKSVPLGELIYLDRERCIQCARCTRFQSEIADDPVIAFHNRGRHLEIVTMSDPGFDSYWSGNTTDICPVGALTTADFRFGARPWELTPAATLSPHDAAGENITVSTRREAKSGGRVVVKRIMPRQNEWVNEIWISDRTRFVHHFAEAADRLKMPLVRKNGQLTPTTWDEALTLVAEKLAATGEQAAGLAGDRLSNEDLFMFQKLFRKALNKNNNIDLANKRLAGGDVTADVGIASGSNLGDLGKGDTIVVIATDLHEEVPIWWLRVKQASERGARLIVLNVRETRLDKHASFVMHYAPGQAIAVAGNLLEHDEEVATAVRDADNLVIFYGYEGLSYDETDALARTLGNLLLETEHVGRPNNGLIAVWPRNNTQGVWDMAVHPGLTPGYRADRNPGLDANAIYAGAESGDITALYIVGADPVGDGLMPGRGALDFMVVQELFLTETAQLADVVLPAQSWLERDGTFTNGERRVQRYNPAIQKVGDSRPDWQILAQVIEKITDGSEKTPFAASLVFSKEIAKSVRAYKDMDYRTLGQVVEQFPKVGGDDLYYGGTSYANEAGIGQQWSASAESKKPKKPFDVPELDVTRPAGLVLLRVAALYTPGTLNQYSELLHARMAKPTVMLHYADADQLGIADGMSLVLRVNGTELPATASIQDGVPSGVALLRGFAWRKGLESAEIVKVQTPITA